MSYLVRGFPGSSLRTRGELGESNHQKKHHCWVPETDLGEMFDQKKAGELELLNSILNMYCMLVFYESELWYKKDVPLWTHISDNVWYHIINSFIFGVYNVDRYQLEGHYQSSNQPWGFSPRSKIEPVNTWCTLIHVNFEWNIQHYPAQWYGLS